MISLLGKDSGYKTRTKTSYVDVCCNNKQKGRGSEVNKGRWVTVVLWTMKERWMDQAKEKKSEVGGREEGSSVGGSLCVHM